VLAERHERLRKIALGNLRDPGRFWEKLERLPTWEKPLPGDLEERLRAMLPGEKLELRVVRRVAGVGSLGRDRFVAIADFRGGKIAREAKALVPSAWWWANGGAGTPQIHCEELLGSAVRAPDPFMCVVPGWTLRRLAPDCARIELSDLPKDRDEKRLLFQMGYEVGNIHLGTSSAKKAIERDLGRRPARWLAGSAREMSKLVTRDFEDWNKSPSVSAEKAQPARTRKR